MKTMGKILRSMRMFYIPLWFLVFLSFCWSHPALAGKDYSILSVIINAHLNSDGSTNIQEKRIYNFKGHFHWATYFLPTNKTGGVVDFSLAEEGKVYSKSYEEKVGTYQYEETSGSVFAKWFFDAQNETRTFILSYKILDAVRGYPDAAILYHQFVGTGWDKPSGQVEVTIYAPESIKREQVRAWAHGPLWGEIKIKDDGSILAKVRSLPKNTFWEIRAIYPIHSFPQIKNVSPEHVIPNILAEEKEWADEANARREEWIKKQESKRARQKYGALVVFVISGIAFGTVISLYNRYGRKHKVYFPDTFYSEFPSDIPPALLSYLLFRGQMGGQALVGTLLDLARRGFLKIKEQMKMKKGIFGTSAKRVYSLEINRDFNSEHKKDLQNFEESLLIFIFDDLAEGQDVIDFETLKKSRNRFIEWFQDWKKEIGSLGESKGYWEKDSLKARNKGIVISLALIAATIISAIFFEKWAIVPGVSAVILLILSSSIPRHTPESELEATKWKALKRYLKKYQFRDSGSPFFLDNIGRFLVYGVVLGLPKEVVKKMVEIIPQGEYNSFFPWYVATHPYTDFSPTGFGEALSSLMTAATSTMSSASGTGGGASGGGGGGSGGSGGGAG